MLLRACVRGRAQDSQGNDTVELQAAPGGRGQVDMTERVRQHEAAITFVFNKGHL